MKQLLLLSIITFFLFSCSRNQDYELTIQAYNDILPDLIKRSYLANEYSVPPPSFENEGDDSLTEIELLKEEIDYLRWQVNRLEKTDQKLRVIRLYHKFIDLDPDEFITTEISVINHNCCDTSWIDKETISKFTNPTTNQIHPNDITISNFRIQLVENIPDSTSETLFQDFHPDIHLFYLQLSAIVFNKSKDKGVLYYGVTNKEKISSEIRYRYIKKYDGQWFIR